MKNNKDKILAKPSGILLQDHVENVLEEGLYIQQIFPISFDKYYKIINKDLSKRLNGAIKFHDVGKAYPKWQNACQKDYENYRKWCESNNGSFIDFSKQNRDLAGKHLRVSGVRHEISSLDMYYDKGFSEPVKVAIAAHHSKLSNKHEKRWIDNSSGKNSSKLWSQFVNLNGCFKNSHDYNQAILKHYEFSGVRAYLQLADHRASSKEEENEINNLNLFSYSFPESWKKRNVQKIAEKYYNDELLLLRAPTGAGKTDACLLWASKQIENHKAERLIMAMPTRFTSNALSVGITESLSDNGLYHSTAWFTNFHNKVKEGNIARDIAKKEHELARKLLTPVTVCTVDHLLMSLTLTREDHHTILFNLANSCVVIDEADFYDEFTQANILVLLEFLRKLKVPTMIMSASLPESSLDMYKSIGYKIEGIKEDVSDNERKRVEIKKIKSYEKVEDLGELLNKCIETNCAIIYANTVAKAIDFFMWFKNKGITPILYHSRYTEPDKMKKEQALLDALGKEAWNNGTAEGIAILTQIGEMSVNISADIMISDLCPMDRLVQRAGRLCRFDKNKLGELYITVPIQNAQIYPAPYGSFSIKKGWTSNKFLIKTLELLEVKKYSAGDFVTLINQVYPDFENFSTKATRNANLLKEKFVSNWIILPADISTEDDTISQDWRSRDIFGNETVFVCYPQTDGFYYWQDYQEYKLENSIDVASYLVKKGIKENRILRKSIVVSGEEVIINIALNCYDFEFGLQLAANAREDQFL